MIQRTRGQAGPVARGWRLWRCALWALWPVSAWLVALPAQAKGDCQLKQMEIPVRMVGQRPIALLTLNGTEVRMLVDSGAFFSMLSESTATQLQLPLRRLPHGMAIEGYTGRIAAKLTRVKTFGLLGMRLNDVDFIVGGNELGAGIMGVLGRNVLSVADTEYDLAHGVVRLVFPKGDCADTDLAYWAGDAPVIEVPLQTGRDEEDTSVQVSVSINGHRTLALLDTGAPQTSLGLAAARRAGLSVNDMSPAGRVGGAGEGQVKSWSAPVAAFALGAEKISDTRLQIDDIDDSQHGVLLGLDYFLSHRIYVSRLQRKVYLTWNGGPAFALGSGNRGQYDTRYAALPRAPEKDDADAFARRGAAAIAAGNHQRALEDLNHACELAPDVADYFFTRARLHLTLNQPGPALADLDRALQLDAKLDDARLHRARLQLTLDKHPAAQADMAQLEATLPESSGLRAELAMLYASGHQVEQALRQFSLWIKTHPRDARLASVLNSRCRMRVRLNIDLPLALQDCEQAVDLDDGSAAIRDSLGWTWLRMGDAAKAKKAFDGAIRLEAWPFSLYGRGLAQLHMNNTAGAEQDLADARALSASIDADVRSQGLPSVNSSAAPQTPAPVR